MSRAARATREPAVEFRPCREGDLDGIVAIERATFPEPWTRSQFAALLAHPAGFGWVAEVAVEEADDGVGHVELARLGLELGGVGAHRYEV